jgi:hypothetical protein
VAGTTTLNCENGEARDFFAAAKGRPLRAAYGISGIQVFPAWRWNFSSPPEKGPTPSFVFRRGGSATLRQLLPEGRYRAWIQGWFSPGVRLEANGRTVGEVHSDLGLYDGWHRLGELEAPPGGAALRLVGRSMPPWQAGSRRYDLTGPVAFEPLDQKRRIVTVPASRQQSLCGQALDWVEFG